MKKRRSGEYCPVDISTGSHSMREGKCLLRQRFQAVTDIEMGPASADWEQYAEWLEALAIKAVNNEMVRENKMLRNMMQKAMEALEKKITGAFAKRR